MEDKSLDKMICGANWDGVLPLVMMVLLAAAAAGAQLLMVECR